MEKIKHWYNKKLAKLYCNKYAEINFNTWRPILFRLPFYSPSLYTYYRWVEIARKNVKMTKKKLKKNNRTLKKINRTLKK